ncbi:MAG: Hsp20/alpha crystallin family protein [Planctomycetota bacterium]|nr:MAG: Hsp20/alpha crystallin family protein [Planctomycetota bacterium]REJ96477.1 MAG: Hsp20/alpha crystallin family protein [Planctomycetota bacterium]REK25121.1 MAG: Hsp20/alpha crystallin family protein [Planctomycetota bacterium]REK40513.1 MAG: Hsp20/alpha crystallin family protein [Planctomycetota bacterium]
MAGTLSKKDGGSLRPQSSRGMFRPFGEDFSEFFNRFLAPEGGSWLAESMAASMDVAETDNSVEVKLDLPGVKPEDISVEVHNGVLMVRGERKDEEDEQDEKRNYHRVERRYGSFSRTVTLPSAVRDEEAVADFKDGVLTIVFPKVEEAKARRIKVKS